MARVEDVVHDAHGAVLGVALGDTPDRSALEPLGEQQLRRRGGRIGRGFGRGGGDGEQAAKHSHEKSTSRMASGVEERVEGASRRVQITDYRERQTKRQLGRDAAPTLPETILDASRHN
jgi:hypothetical protein